MESQDPPDPSADAQIHEMFNTRMKRSMGDSPFLSEKDELLDARQKCFKALLKVSTVEDDIQFLENEIHGKALQVTRFPQRMKEPDMRRFDLNTKFQSISDVHKDCVKCVQNNWRWLTSLSKCIPSQVEQAADYHEFFHEAEHLGQVLVTWLHWIRKEEVNKTAETPSDRRQTICHLTKNLLQCQHNAEKLCTMAKKVAPLPYRYELPEHGSVALRSLVTYSHGEFTVHEGDICTLVDNSNTMEWKVKNSEGVIGEVPPVSMLLDSVSSNAVDKSLMLREQMAVLWDLTRKLQNTRVVQLLKELTSDAEQAKLENFSRDHKNDVLLMLRTAVHNLDLDRLPEEDFTDLNESVESLFNKVGYLPSSDEEVDAEIAAQTLDKWKELNGLTNALQDLATYADHYSGSLRDQVTSAKLFVGAEEKPCYVSKAFVQRMKTVPLNYEEEPEDKPEPGAPSACPRDSLACFAEGAINCRPQCMDSAENDGDKPRAIGLEVPCETSGEDVGEIFTKSTVQQTTKFRVSGVKRPGTEEVISLADAVEAGIVNQEEGTYCNPEDGQPLSSMSEAIAAGDILIEAAETQRDFESVERTPLGRKGESGVADVGSPEEEELQETYAITGVMDPKTNKMVPPARALRLGYVDPNRGVYVSRPGKHMGDGDTNIPIADAVQRGLISLQQMNGATDTTDRPPNGNSLAENSDKLAGGDIIVDSPESQPTTPGHRIKSTRTATVARCFAVDNVLDPRTKYRVSLHNAVRSGIVDSTGGPCASGVYQNPESGESMRLQEAMAKGLVKAEPTDLVVGKVRASVLQLESRQKMVTTYVMPPAEAKKDPNSLAFKALSKQCDTLTKGVRSPVAATNGGGPSAAPTKLVSLKDAYGQGLIEYDCLEYIQPGEGANGKEEKRIPFEEAVAEGLIKMAPAQQLLQGANYLGLSEDSTPTAALTDPSTGRPLSVHEAVEAEVLDPYTTFLREPESGQPMTLECALRRGLVDPDQPALELLQERGQSAEAPVIAYTKPMKEAFLRERLLAALGDKPVEVGIASGLQSSPLSHSGEQETIPLDRALMEGLYKPDIAAVVRVGDMGSGRPLSLPEAVEEGLVSKEAAGALYSAYDDMSVQRALDNNLLDRAGNCPVSSPTSVTNGDIIDSGVGLGSGPESPLSPSSAITPLSEAIESGQVVPECLFLVDKRDDSLRSLAAFIEAGEFDPQTCQFVLDGERLSIDEAVAKDKVDLDVKPWRFVPVEAPLIELMGSRALSEKSRLRIDDSRVLTVKDALGSKLVSYHSPVRVGPGKEGVPSTAELVEQGPVLGPLADIPDEIEWLSERELEVAREAKPYETASELAKQIENLEGVQEKLAKRGPRMDTLLEECQKLLEQNKDDERDEVEEQQYQQLRISAADLRATRDKTHKYLRGQLKKLQNMRGFLEDFYEKQHTFDDWCDTTDKLLTEAEKQSVNMDRIEDCLSNYKALQGEINAQETKWLGLQTTGFKFLAEAVEFEKNADVFRQSIHKPITKGAVPHTQGLVQPGTDASLVKFDKVKNRNDSIRAAVDENCARASKFKALDAELERWLPEVENYLGAQSVEELVSRGDAQAVQKAVSELTALNADLAKHLHTVEDLDSLASVLSPILESAGREDQANKVRSSGPALKDRCVRAEEEVAQRLQALNERLVKSQDIDKMLEELLGWSRENADMFPSADGEGLTDGKDFKVSLNPEKLEEQMADVRQVEADLKNYVMKLNSVEESAGPEGATPEAAAVMAEIKQNFARLFTSVEAREALLDSYCDRLESLGEDMSSLDNWLVEALRSLQEKAAVAEPAAIKSYFDELYAEKKSRQPDEEAIKKGVRELVDDPVTKDKRHLQSRQTDLAAKWHDFTALLVDLVVVQALRDVDDLEGYFLDYEKRHLESMEPILIESEHAGIQLREFRGHHEELGERREEALGIMQKCSKMLCETSGDDRDKANARIGGVRALVGSIWRQSQNRLTKLEEVVPLIQHFNESRANLEAWLANITSEVNAIDTLCESTEQIKKQQEAFKTSLRFIDEHRPVLQDLNTAGQELEQLDNEAIPRTVSALNARYDALKASVREQINELAERFRKITTEVTEALDGILGELTDLNNQIDNAEPVAVTMDKIQDQIDENNGIIEERAKRQDAICSLKGTAHELIEQVKGQPEKIDEDKLRVDVEDIEFKIEEMERLNAAIHEKTGVRSRSLSEALDVARKFWDLYKEVVLDLQELQDNVRDQGSPQVELELLEDQEREQQECKECLEKVIPKLEAIRRQSESLAPIIGETGKIELTKNVEDMGEVFEELGDAIEDRKLELAEAHEKCSRFETEMKAVLAWLPRMEETLANMGPMSLDIRNLKIQIEEVKILKLQLSGKCVAVESLNNQVTALNRKSAKAVDQFVADVSDINDRWNKIVEHTTDREQQLQENLIRLGELDVALEDINGYLQQVEDDLHTVDKVYGDPKFLETHLKKLKMVQDDLANQEGVVMTLNRAINELADMGTAGQTSRHVPLLAKQEEMNELWGSVSTLIRDKRNILQDKLTAVQVYLGDMEGVINWLAEFEQTMKSVKTIGALPETAQKQCEKFNEYLTQLNTKNDDAHALLLAGEDMLQAFGSHPFNTVQLRSTLGKLRRSCDTAKKQAKKKKQKLQEHLQNVTGFHSVMKIFKDWLVNGEQNLSKFKNPSKLVPTIQEQIKSHRDFHEDVEAHREIVERLDRTGTYLKYYGARNDAVVIRGQLISIKLRWKRLLWKTEERGRILEQAHREDQRFAGSWEDMLNWLDETKTKLDKLAESKPSVHRTREIIDEVKTLELQMSRNHPRYYSTVRLGRNLKDRCTKTDPEKEVLNNMLEQLKKKWARVRTDVSQRQTQLDEQLLETGRLAEAFKSLSEWIDKAEDTFSSSQPVLGDQETVTSLVDHHRALEEEMAKRRAVLNTLQTASDPADPKVVAQLDTLTERFEKVQALYDQKEARLQEALKMACEFQEAVNALRDFLPQAEAELKFQALPTDDEVALQSLIDSHDDFERQMSAMDPHVERIKSVGGRIMDACHPNAVRFVKYYLTITNTRWEQLVERARNRRKRLQDAAATAAGNSARLDELMAWLSEAEVLLMTKEDDEIPEDMAVVDELLKEHMDFHEELSDKGKEVEDFTTPAVDPTRSQIPKVKSGNGPKDPLESTVNPRIVGLQNKWRAVWRMSIDRKNRLQEQRAYLLELESVKNFDFEAWRKRYLEWIKAKKLRITDFFRRYEKNEDGTVSRADFITGMLSSKFPTNRAEINAVFNIFDRDRSGTINYKEFIDALRPLVKKPKRAPTESEQIQDEIEREVSQCKCRTQFKFDRVDEKKYRFGENQKLVLVRFLNSTVMVRVGGGWETLHKFLENHDPCKAKGRTNTELREQFLLPDGSSQSRATFSGRRKPSTPTNGDRTSPSSTTSGASADSKRRSVTPTATKPNGAPGSATPRRKAATPTPSRGTPTPSRGGRR